MPLFGWSRFLSRSPGFPFHPSAPTTIGTTVTFEFYTFQFSDKVNRTILYFSLLYFHSKACQNCGVHYLRHSPSLFFQTMSRFGERFESQRSIWLYLFHSLGVSDFSSTFAYTVLCELTTLSNHSRVDYVLFGLSFSPDLLMFFFFLFLHSQF